MVVDADRGCGDSVLADNFRVTIKPAVECSTPEAVNVALIVGVDAR